MEDWEDTAGAFGHWTYVATEGRLMVSDLQGVCVGHHSLKLTDPQVHCARTPELTAHEASCFGRVGMLKFFQSHQCNYICKELGLPDALEEISKLQSDLDELTNSDGDVDGAADAVAGMSVRD